MTSWYNTTIGELGEVITGYTPPTKKTEYFGIEYPFITPTDMSKNARIVETERFLSQKGYEYRKNRLLPPNSVCFTCIGATIGKICMTNVSSATNQQINSIIVNRSKHNPNFVYYLLRNETERIKGLASGAATPIIKKSTFSSVGVCVPNLPTQRKIALILSAYDDLIENNTRRIKILEEMAQTIYREWFVHFRFPGHEKVKMVGSEMGLIPEGWEVKKLGDKITFLRGKTITKKDVISGKIPVVAAGLSPAYFHNQSNVKAPVVTISASGANAGFINLYYEDIWASDCSYISKETVKSIYFYYSMVKHRQAEITGLQRGSAQPHVYPKDLMRLEIVDAPVDLISRYEKLAESIFSEIGILKRKNKTLRQTRDFLLPKLISGEVDVSELDIDISEV